MFALVASELHFSEAEMRAMTMRRIRNYASDVDQMRSDRDLRSLTIQRVAAHADAPSYERFRAEFERTTDGSNDIRTVSLEELANETR